MPSADPPVSVSDPAPLHVTVAVCTWNRSRELARTLESMTRLVRPAEVTWELLVVNNRSSDDTDDVIRSFQDRLPIRRLWEVEPGLSNARNRALAEATGEYVLWTDDDVLVHEDWLAEYVAAFRRWPEADVFGGPIEPLFEGEPPGWLPRILDQISAVYGRQDLGDQPVPLVPERAGEGPYGGNMAMRRTALLHLGFDPTLGVRHAEYAIGEETAVVRQLLSSGRSGWWTPGPRVSHRIPQSSQTLAYVRRWMVGAGRSRALYQKRSGSTPPFQSPPWLLARMIRHEVQFRVRRHLSPPENWIMDLVRASQAWGQLQASLRPVR